MKLLKIILFLCLSFALQAQDTTCISTARLGRIADTLQHYKHYKQAFEACEDVLQVQQQQAQNYQQQLAAKDVQIAAMSEAYNEADKARATWQESASECNAMHEKTYKQLQKAKKARKGWTGAAVGFMGALGAGITITAIILKK